MYLVTTKHHEESSAQWQWSRPGVGVTKLRSWISLLWEILLYQMCMLDSLNYALICHVSPQLSWGNTCQLWTLYSIGNQCLIVVKNKENIGTGTWGDNLIWGQWRPHYWSNKKSIIQYPMSSINTYIFMQPSEKDLEILVTNTYCANLYIHNHFRVFGRDSSSFDINNRYNHHKHSMNIQQMSSLH